MRSNMTSCSRQSCSARSIHRVCGMQCIMHVRGKRNVTVLVEGKPIIMGLAHQALSCSCWCTMRPSTLLIIIK
jgi:hypothetical protein